MRIQRRLYALLAVIALCIINPCQAADEDLTWPPLLQDAGAYVTAPLRWDQHDWLLAGGVLATIAASHEFDNRISRHFDHGATDVSSDPHTSKDWLPAVGMLAGTATMALLFDDHAGYRETLNMAEAGAFSVVSALVLKQVARRARPGEGSSNDWFKGGNSFPSTHVTAAVAIGTVLAESGGDDYRWIRRGLGYGLGATTVYLRLKHQQHWLSDTVAGAALGWSTANFVLHRRSAGDLASLTLMPMNDGAMLSYSVALH